MSQPSRRDWVIAQGYTTLRHSPFIGPTSHPVPTNSWRQLPAFISAPSSDQKPTFGSYHLDSFCPLQLRSILGQPCHVILLSTHEDIGSRSCLPGTFATTGVPMRRAASVQRGNFSRGQVPSAQSQLRRVRSEFAPSRRCSPLPSMCEGFPTIRR